MKDSNHRKNARMDISKDSDPAAFKHESRQMAEAKHGLGRRIMSHEQRREILNELFFEGEERMPYVRKYYSLLAISTWIAAGGLM